MNCLICNVEMKTLGKSKKFIIYKCSDCGFGATKGTKIQRKGYYRDETYIDEDRLFNNIFSKRAKIINELIKTGKVLEIGCSTGIFLKLLEEKDWDIQGVEISKKSAEVAKSRGIDVIVVPFEKIKFSEKFDLVILNHTLEHLEDPIEVLKKIRSILKPKGYLYIDLPNFGGLSARILGTNWQMLLPKEHFWHFGEKSLKKLLNDMGFRIIFVEKASGIYDYGKPIYGVMLSLFTFKKRFFGEILTALPSFIVSKFGIGSDLMIIARKI